MKYYLLRSKFRELAQRQRVIDNLMRLRTQLDACVPDKDPDNNLLLATWNIRDFAKKNRRGFGERLPESHFYLAEIISRFDFVAVQEVNELDEWEDLMEILGPDWSYMATDVTDTKLGGNGERLTYVFDRRKVRFQNIAGEIVLPMDMLISQVNTQLEGEKVIAGKQFNRSPYLASFSSGWFKFDICTVHLYYGADSGKQLQQRIEEISRIAEYLGKRADESLKHGSALILLGDFNIVHPEHKTMQALVEQGFLLPKSLRRPTNIDRTKYYDQIAFKTSPAVIEYIDRESTDPKKCNAGVFEILESVFKDDDFEQYREHVLKSSTGAKKSPDELDEFYLTWRTYQMSDHKPMWVRLNTNDSQRYLERLKGGEDREPTPAPPPARP